MFDLSWAELAFLAMLALLVVGPRDLPRLARGMGRLWTKLQRTYRDSLMSLRRLENELELAQDAERGGQPSYYDLLPDHVRQALEVAEPLRDAAENQRRQALYEEAVADIERARQGVAPEADAAREGSPGTGERQTRPEEKARPEEDGEDAVAAAPAAAALDLSQAPLLSHLLELRRRLLWCLLVFALVFAGCYLVVEQIYAFLLRPLLESFSDESGRRMIYTGLHEAFLTYLKLAFFSALFITLPVILIQLWGFIAPGLYRDEQHAVRILFLLTPLLFLLGAALAYYLVFPLAWGFFLGFESGAEVTGLAVQLEARVSEYLDLVIRLVLAFGLSFELPIVLLLLARVGVVSSTALAEGRRYAVVIIFAVAALITPPDLISQIALGTPVLLLYEASIWIIRLLERRREQLPQAGSA